MPALPLSGLRILDLTRLLPGPYCSMILADLGADVVKVEEPGLGDPARATPPFLPDGTSALFRQLNRGKRSVALNLKAPKGRDLFLRLAAHADAVLEGFRPGVAKRLGVDFAAVHAVNPRAVYASISAYGHASPLMDVVGHDLNCVAMAGLLDMNRTADGRVAMPGAQIADIGSGLAACVAVLAALRERDATGKGRFLDLSMHDVALAFGSEWAAESVGGRDVERAGAVLAGSHACYNLYECSDGLLVTLGALEPHFWTKACEALDMPGFADAQFAEGPEQKQAIAAFRRRFKERPREEWLKRLQAAGVPAAPVRTVPEAVQGEPARSRGMVLEDGAVNSPLGPVWGVRPARAAPALGEHTRDVLAEAGASAKDLTALRAEGVIGGD